MKKLLLYFENQKKMKQSGIGRARLHQEKALKLKNIEYTLDPKDNDYDAVHINTLFFSSYKVLKKCKKKGLKVIVHGHSTIEDFRNSFRCWKLVAPLYNKLILRMYRKADAIITPTEYSKHLIENYKGVKCPVYAVSNGIMLEDYAKDEKKINAFKDYFKLDPNKKVVISVGLYFDRKGILDFFDIARKMPDVTFIWFGNLAPILTQHRILKAIKNRPANVIMPGYISGDVIKGAFNSADAFLFMSKEETEGIVVLEALACKCPVVLRDIPVYSEWLTDKKEVLKVKNNDEAINALNYVFENDLSSMKENGYKVVCDRTLDKIGDELKKIYDSVYKGERDE